MYIHIYISNIRAIYYPYITAYIAHVTRCCDINAAGMIEKQQEDFLFEVNVTLVGFLIRPPE